MLRELPYERGQALEYARRWALGRNPLFYNFTGQGGDCTNFISQCLLAGCLVMNCRETFGWYYHSPRLRAPAWTGVQYLWNFLSGNAGAGPYGREAELAELVTGDLVQLGGEDGRYYHTLFICGRRGGELLIAAHSFDAFERPLSSYDYARLRPIKIEGCRAVRTPPPGGFERLLSGEALPPGGFERLLSGEALPPGCF